MNKSIRMNGDFEQESHTGCTSPIDSKTKFPMGLWDFLNVIMALCPDCQAKLRTLMAPSIPANLTKEQQEKTVVDRQLSRIIHQVSESTGVPMHKIIGKDNREIFVNARRIAVQAARQNGFSFPAIGLAMNRHHTSIVYLAKSSKRVKSH